MTWESTAPKSSSERIAKTRVTAREYYKRDKRPLLGLLGGIKPIHKNPR